MLASRRGEREEGVKPTRARGTRFLAGRAARGFPRHHPAPFSLTHTHTHTHRQRHSFAEHFSEIADAPKLAGHSVFQEGDIDAMAAYVGSGKRAKIVSYKRGSTTHTEEHFVGSVDDGNVATVFPSKDGTHPSGRVDLAEFVGKVAWPSRTKGLAQAIEE